MQDAEAFARLVSALRPWLGDVVIVGGWAHRLHRFHPLADPPGYQPILTKDADVAILPGDLFEGDIAEALKAEDFEEELSGEHTPPISQYTLSAAGGFFVEFLAPLIGSGHKRGGEPDATVAAAGITAQKLRHLDLLMIEALTVHLGGAVDFPLDEPAAVRIAHPVTFIGQKLLIHDRRSPDKKPQDVLYIHDTLELFGSNIEMLGEHWKIRIRGSIPDRTADRIESLATSTFVHVNDVIREAIRIPQDRELRPDIVQARCAYGLERIFGD